MVGTKLLFYLFLIFVLPLRGHALINGRLLHGEPDIVRLVFQNDWVCTGVFLNKYTILTAAHCLSDGQVDHRNPLRQVLSENDVALDITEIKSIRHPEYREQSWPAYDIGIIKTSENKKIKGNFKLDTEFSSHLGAAILYGCGKTDVADDAARSRAIGENNFLRLGGILFFIGSSRSREVTSSSDTTIAPNDSRGPILDKESGKIIAIATETTAKQSAEYRMPALSIGTSTSFLPNRKFIESHLGKVK